MSYLVTKLDQRSLDYVNYLTNARRGTNLSTTIGVAKAVADMLLLPQNPVEGIEDYYRALNSIHARTMIGKLNDLVLIEFERVSEITERYYRFKYDLMFSVTPMSIFTDTPVADVLGLNHYFDKELLDTIKATAPEIAKVYNESKYILALLKEKS